MGKVILGMTISLDGFVNDRQGSVASLYPDMAELRDTLEETIRTTGAVVMGRHSYDMANGDFTGYEFQTPIFVVTHQPPAQAAKGENDRLKFHFVTEGVESAIQRAKAAAGDQNVVIVGGADIFQQSIKNGLADELHIDIIPILLCDGLRLFEKMEHEPIRLETVSVTALPHRTQMIFRVVKD